MIYGSPLPLHVGFGHVDMGRASFSSFYHIIGSTIRHFWFPMAHLPPTPSVTAYRSIGGALVLVHAALAIWYFRRPETRHVRNLSVWHFLAVTLAGYLKLLSAF